MIAVGVAIAWRLAQACVCGSSARRRHDRRVGSVRYEPVTAAAGLAAEGYSPRFAEDDAAEFDDLMEQVLRDARSEETRARLEGELVLDSPVGDGKQTYQL